MIENIEIMASLKCPAGIFKFEINLLIGCNGKPHSDEFLKYLLNLAIENESYENAKIYQNEINKRKESEV